MAMAVPTNEKAPYRFDQYGEATPFYEQQAQVVPVQGHPHVQGHLVEGQPVELQVMARCKGCGKPFARATNVNPASAQFHRCTECNKRQARDMLCVNATCGASSLCVIQ